MGPSVRVETVPPAGLLALSAELTDVYRAAFGREPWNETEAEAAAFAGRLPEEVRRPGFRAAVARDGDGALAGFAYGSATPAPFPGGRAYDDARLAVGAARAGALSGTFEVMEVAVRPGAVRRGAGRRLLAAIVRDRPAWLLTAEFASAAVAFYEACGWRRLGAGRGIVVYAWSPPGA